MRVSRLIQVEAADPAEAMAEARRVADLVRAHEGVRLEIVTDGESPDSRPLYPNYSREFLERLYSDQSAALQLAILDKLPSDATPEQILDATWEVISRSQVRATRAASMRALMNVEGTKQ